MAASMFDLYQLITVVDLTPHVLHMQLMVTRVAVTN